MLLFITFQGGGDGHRERKGKSKQTVVGALGKAKNRSVLQEKPARISYTGKEVSLPAKRKKLSIKQAQMNLDDTCARRQEEKRLPGHGGGGGLFKKTCSPRLDKKEKRNRTTRPASLDTLKRSEPIHQEGGIRVIAVT